MIKLTGGDGGESCRLRGLKGSRPRRPLRLSVLTTSLTIPTDMHFWKQQKLTLIIIKVVILFLDQIGSDLSKMDPNKSKWVKMDQTWLNSSPESDKIDIDCGVFCQQGSSCRLDKHIWHFSAQFAWKSLYSLRRFELHSAGRRRCRRTQHRVGIQVALVY